MPKHHTVNEAEINEAMSVELVIAITTHGSKSGGRKKLTFIPFTGIYRIYNGRDSDMDMDLARTRSEAMVKYNNI